MLTDISCPLSTQQLSNKKSPHNLKKVPRLNKFLLPNFIDMTKLKQVLCLGLLLLLCPLAMAQQRVPVVFHVISSDNGGTFTQPSDLLPSFPIARMQDQLQRLQTEFNNAGANIDFCLAETAPVAYAGDGVNGCTWQPFSVPGLTYTISNTLNLFETVTQGNYATAAQAVLPFQQVGANDPRYLNIYVVEGVSINFDASFEGAANLGINAAFDGVVIQHDVFGDLTNGGTYTMLPNGDQGKTLVHEVGHWLSLQHVFDPNGNCNTDDGLADTPPQQHEGNTYGANPSICHPLAFDCITNSVELPLNNHMDYVADQCKVARIMSSVGQVNSFTSDQVNRMQAYLQNNRAAWVSGLNLIRTGCATTSVSADFTMAPTTLCAGDLVELIGMDIDPTKLPIGTSIGAWAFTFNSPANSFSHQYAGTGLPIGVSPTTGGALAAGTYEVTLTVNFTDATGNQSVATPIAQTLVVEECGASALRFNREFCDVPNGRELRNLAIVPTPDAEGYIVAGTGRLNNRDHVVVFRMDLAGDIIWEQTFEDAQNDIRSFDIVQNNQHTGAEAYVVTGSVSNATTNDQLMVLEFIDNGGSATLVTQQTLPVTSTTPNFNASIGLEIINTDNGGFAIAGGIGTGFAPANRKNQLVVKLSYSPTAPFFQVQWQHEIDLSDATDANDNDLANSIVEITNYQGTSPAYFVGGAKTKERDVTRTSQAVSSVLLEDHGNQAVVMWEDSWETPSPDNDYSIDVIYDHRTNLIYQKAFTQFTHGEFIVRINPADGSIHSFLELNLLNLGLEYVGLKLIKGQRNNQLVTTGLNGSTPTATLLDTCNWAQPNTAIPGVLNLITVRNYTTVDWANNLFAGDFPNMYFNSGLPFYYAPKSICRSPNGGYMQVIGAEQFNMMGNAESRLNVLKLDEELRLSTHCADLFSGNPSTMFIPVPTVDTVDEIATVPTLNSGNLTSANMQLDCKDICTSNEIPTFEQCGDNGQSLFDLTALLGVSATWENGVGQPISTPTAYLGSNGESLNYKWTTDCGLVTGTVKLLVTPNPSLANITLNACEDVAGIRTATFNLAIQSSPDDLVTWWEDQSSNGLTGQITDPANYIFDETQQDGIVYVEVTNTNGCSSIAEVTLQIDNCTPDIVITKEAMRGGNVIDHVYVTQDFDWVVTITNTGAPTTLDYDEIWPTAPCGNGLAINPDFSTFPQQDVISIPTGTTTLTFPADVCANGSIAGDYINCFEATDLTTQTTYTVCDTISVLIGCPANWTNTTGNATGSPAFKTDLGFHQVFTGVTQMDFCVEYDHHFMTPNYLPPAAGNIIFSPAVKAANNMVDPTYTYTETVFPTFTRIEVSFTTANPFNISGGNLKPISLSFTINPGTDKCCDYLYSCGLTLHLSNGDIRTPRADPADICIENPATPLNVNLSTSANCFSGNSIDLTVSGAFDPATSDISWGPGASNFGNTMLSINQAGTYYVKVRDEKGCKDSVAIAMEDCLPITCQDCDEVDNLIVNGDFETFPTPPFLTALNNSCACAIGSYCIGSEPRDKCTHAGWIDDLWDHTHGNTNGHFMIIDGQSSFPSPIWTQQNINVVQGETYEFSFWHVRAISGSSSAQSFEAIIGGSVAQFETANSPAHDWTKYCATWVADQTGTISISIVQTGSTTAPGETDINDYGIDDISFGTCKKECEGICDIAPKIEWETKDGCTYNLIGINDGSDCPEHIYEWTITDPFGNSTTVNGQYPSYSFYTSGTHYLTLRIYVLDDNGEIRCEKKTETEINVECEGCKEPCDLAPAMEWSTKDGCYYNFFGMNKGQECPSQQYEWTIYDQYGNLVTTLTGKNTGYQFTSDGNYKICLRIYVLNKDGKIQCEKHICHELTIKADCKEKKEEDKTALDPLANKLSVQVYPNPANDHVTIQVTRSTEAQAGDVLIYTLTGKQVAQAKLSTNMAATVNVSRLSAGVYLYKVLLSNGQLKVGKLVIE